MSGCNRACTPVPMMPMREIAFGASARAATAPATAVRRSVRRERSSSTASRKPVVLLKTSMHPSPVGSPRSEFWGKPAATLITNTSPPFT